MADEKEAVKALMEIALSSQRVMVERQRAIDAITLFPQEARDAYAKIVKECDQELISGRAGIYLQRIKDGLSVSMTL